MGIKCEICGSTSLMKKGDSFVCQSCGISYSKESIREMMSSTNNTNSIDSDDNITSSKVVSNNENDLSIENVSDPVLQDDGNLVTSKSNINSNVIDEKALKELNELEKSGFGVTNDITAPPFSYTDDLDLKPNSRISFITKNVTSNMLHLLIGCGVSLIVCLILFNISNEKINSFVKQKEKKSSSKSDSSISEISKNIDIETDDIKTSSFDDSSSIAEPVIEETVTTTTTVVTTIKPEKTQKVFEVIKGAYTWTEAENICEEKGGHLASITSDNDYNSIIDAAEESGLEFLWLGGLTFCEGDEVYAAWIDNTDFTYVEENKLWFRGEPSGKDPSDPSETLEPYVMLWKIGDEWSLNDNSDAALKYYRDSLIGFVCEYDD